MDQTWNGHTRDVRRHGPSIGVWIVLAAPLQGAFEAQSPFLIDLVRAVYTACEHGQTDQATLRIVQLFFFHDMTPVPVLANTTLRGLGACDPGER
jgi:hypothetical protein